MRVSVQPHAQATLIPGKEPPGTHSTRGWVGPTAGLDVLEKKIICCLRRDPKLRSSSPQPSHYID